MEKLAIVIITYNCHEIFMKQMDKIKLHCKNSFDVIVVDNSTRAASIEAISYYVSKLTFTCKYIRTKASSKNGSESHAFAANLAYSKIKEGYTHFLFLDHDCFPIKDFSVLDILKDKQMAGLGQAKEKTYFWAGCVMFKRNDLIDFSPNNELHLDTGGNLYKTMEAVGPQNLIFFDEAYSQNEGFNKSKYNFYSLINDGMFMHFINASNWNGSMHNEERLNSLINILDKYESNTN